jgi:hypothetical protein
MQNVAHTWSNPVSPPRTDPQLIYYYPQPPSKTSPSGERRRSVLNVRCRAREAVPDTSEMKTRIGHSEECPWAFWETDG